MKRLVAIASCIVIGMPTLLLAQPRPSHHHHHHHHHRPSHGPSFHRPPYHRPPYHQSPYHNHGASYRPGYGSSWGWNGHRYHGGAFHYPPGYGYRRYGLGMVLPAPFLASPYYFDRYATLGLAAPPYGYRWVRYGPDALLVNLRTGEIVRVERGVIY